MPWFLIEPSGYRYPISENEEDGLSIGRTPDNDVILSDPGVSRHHAYIRVRGQEAWLYDRNSANGVWLNSERIDAPRLMKHGDVIQVGSTQLRMMYAPPEPPPASPTTPAAPVRKKSSATPYVVLGALLGLLGLASVGLAVLTGFTRTSTPTLASSPYVRYADAIRATVFVLTPVGDTPDGRAGTGVILTEKGRILTAYSVVINPVTGRPYNRSNQVMVGVRPAKGGQTGNLVWYLAHVVRADRQRDMAVLQIYALRDGSPLPNSFHLRAISLGDSDALRPDDPVSVISFPAGGEGVGPSLGKALALGEGRAVAFLPDTAIQAERGWIVTDIALSQSNIGAPALDGEGRLVGLYPGPDASQKSGAGNNVRPINLARPLWVTGP